MNHECYRGEKRADTDVVGWSFFLRRLTRTGQATTEWRSSSRSTSSSEGSTICAQAVAAPKKANTQSVHRAKKERACVREWEIVERARSGGPKKTIPKEERESMMLSCVRSKAHLCTCLSGAFWPLYGIIFVVVVVAAQVYREGRYMRATCSSVFASLYHYYSTSLMRTMIEAIFKHI